MYSPNDREKERMRKREIILKSLQKFEKKLNFDPISIKRKAISIAFFIEHVLLHLIVLECVESDGAGGDYLILYAILKDDHEYLKWKGNVLEYYFYGIGQRHSDGKWDLLTTFEYCATTDLFHMNEHPVTPDEVIRNIRQRQQWITENIDEKQIDRDWNSRALIEWIIDSHGTTRYFKHGVELFRDDED